MSLVYCIRTRRKWTVPGYLDIQISLFLWISHDYDYIQNKVPHLFQDAPSKDSFRGINARYPLVCRLFKPLTIYYGIPDQTHLETYTPRRSVGACCLPGFYIIDYSPLGFCTCAEFSSMNQFLFQGSKE